MTRIAKKQSITWLALALPLLLPISSGAAENILQGGVTVGQDYDSNINRTPSAEQSEWKSTITPSLVFTRSEQTNTLSIKYAPTVVYSYLTDKERTDQFASAQYDISLTRKLHIRFQDTFVLADEPYSDPVSGVVTGQAYDRQETIQLSENRGGNRYWINNFATRADFEYAQESSVKLGYQYQVLNNKNPGYSDFIKQSPDISILHRINHQWDTQFDYRFVKGDFEKSGDLASNASYLDQSEDLTTNAPDLYLYYKLAPITKIFGHYGYSRTDYDGFRKDYNWQKFGAGTKHQFSPTLHIDFEGGISLLHVDNSSDTNALYLRSTLNKTWERSSWSLSANSGMDNQLFNGTNDKGPSRFWDISSAFNHSLTKDITGTISLLYRDDTYLERLTKNEEQQFQGNLLLAYSFARWYQIALRYTYINLNADLEINQYNDHRILLQLSAIKDLLKW